MRSLNDQDTDRAMRAIRANEQKWVESTQAAAKQVEHNTLGSLYGVISRHAPPQPVRFGFGLAGQLPFVQRDFFNQALLDSIGSRSLIASEAPANQVAHQMHPPSNFNDFLSGPANSSASTDSPDLARNHGADSAHDAAFRRAIESFNDATAMHGAARNSAASSSTDVFAGAAASRTFGNNIPGNEQSSPGTTHAESAQLQENLTPGKLLWLYATNQLSDENKKLVENAITAGISEGVDSGEEQTFGLVRKAKDWIVNDYFGRGLQKYEEVCALQGIKPNVTSMAYAGPGLATTGLGLIPDTPDQAATEVAIIIGAEPIAATGMWLYHSAKGGGIIKKIAAAEIKFSQSSINGWKGLSEGMQKTGWRWTEAPIDVVKMGDGSLITLDNTRVFAAHESGIELRAIIREFDQEIKAKNMIERFWTKKDGYPKTWGDAVNFRINKQNSTYRNVNSNGSEVVGLSNKP